MLNPMNADFVGSLSTELEVVRQFCLRRSVKVAVAESVTAGIVQALFSTMNEAGLFYKGGITAYCCEMKTKLLDIPFNPCTETNGVDQGITDTMARNICSLFDADLGIALTGYASPIPEQDIYERLAFGSIYYKGKLIFSKRFSSSKENQFEVQLDYARQLIKISATCLAECPE